MLLTIFTHNILPPFILIGFGVILNRSLKIEVKSLSRLSLYILSPCLIFSSLSQSAVSGTDLYQILSFVVLVSLVMCLISWALSRLLGLDQVMTNAFILSTVFQNAGNYGLPVVLLAFGKAGLERAIIFFVGSALLGNTLAVYFASRGRAGVIQSALNTFKLPMIYAILLAFLFKGIGLTVPVPLLRALELGGNAAIPMMLLILGIQLSRASPVNNLALVALATLVKLIIEAGVAVPLTSLLGLEGLTQQVCIVEASMPTAVTTIVMAVEFEADREFVTSVVFISTLASAFSLTLLLALIA